MFSQHVWASPASLTYQGRIIKSDGTALEYSNVAFLFQITDPTGTCVIYQEQRSGYNMVNSGGVFDVPISTGTVQYPLVVTSVLEVFNNTKTTPYTCGTCSASGSTYTCANSGSTYLPSSGDSRKLRVSFFDGSGWKTITPDNDIRTVPFAAYSLSSQKLGDYAATDFLIKAGLPTCSAGTFLSWNGTSLSCTGVTSTAGGTVQTVTASAGSSPYLQVSADTINPVITLNVGSTTGTVAAGDDSRFSDSRIPKGSAGGVLTGTYPNPSLADNSVTDLKIANGAVSTAKLFANPGINRLVATDASTGATLAPLTCTANQLLTWNAATGWQCTAQGSLAVGSATSATNFSGSLAGDVSGTQGATSVDKIKGVGIDFSTAPTTGQLLKFNGTNWVASSITSALPAFSGDVTSTAGSSVLTLSSVGTAGTYTKVTTDANGRVTSGTNLSAADIPNLDFSKITTGKPTTVGGYGITDAVKNLGNVSGIQSDVIANRPAAGTAGRVFISTDSQEIYQDNGSSWVKVAAVSSAVGNVTSVTSANTDISVANTTSTPVITLNSGTGPNQIVKLDASSKLPAVDGSALTNITTTIDKITNAAGKYFDYKPNNAACTNGQILSYTTGTGWVCSTAATGTVTAVTGTAPIVSSGGTAPAISITQATTSTDGYLSSADWNTFNNKQAALGFTPLNKASNLSDLASASTARTNLGLGGAATLNVGTSTGTVAAGDDSRIVNAVQNSGVGASSNITSMQAGLDTSKPAAGTAGRVYLATDAQKIYRDNGTSWDTIASSGGGGTITSVTAGTGLSGGGSSGSVTLNLANIGTAGTYTKVTTDAQGRVTAGTTLSATDIPNLDWSKITTGKPTTVSGYGITDAVTSVTATAPIVSSGGATPAISISQATTSTDGYLSSTDWNTFNNKQAALGFTPLNKASNLSDLASASTARTNLGLGGAATLSVGTGAGTVAAGDDSRIVNAVQNAGSGAGNVIKSIQSGNTAARPAASTDGRLYIDTQAGVIYRDNGTSWDTVASSGGAGGTITGVTAGTGLTGGGTSGTVTVNLASIANNNILANTSGSSAAPVATTLTALLDTIGNAQGSVLYRGSSGWSVLAPGTNGQYLQTQGAAANPQWASVSVSNFSGSLSGDVSGTQTATSVNKIKGQSVSATATTAGQVMRYDGTNWTPNFISMADLRSTVTGTSALTAGCSSNQTLTWIAATDNLACVNISLPAGQVTGALSAANGGTGQTTYAVGDLLYASTTSALSRLPSSTSGYVLTSNGAGAAPSWQAVTAASGGGWVNTNTTILSNGAMSTTWTTVDLSGTIGANKTLVMFQVSGLSAAQNIQFRTKGEANSIGYTAGANLGAGSSACTVAAGAYACNILVQTNTSGQVEYALQSSTATGTIVFTGYVVPAVGFLPNVWSLNSTNAYYNSGNVGIGTASPAAKLDVAGEVKFGNTSSTCNSTNEGQQRYNSTTKKMEYCNGTAWTMYGTPSQIMVYMATASTKAVTSTYSNVAFDGGSVGGGSDYTYSSSTNNFKVTVNTAGTYLISYKVYYTQTNVGATTAAKILVNGTTLAVGSVNALTQVPTVSGIGLYVTNEFLTTLNAADYISLQVKNNNNAATITAPDGIDAPVTLTLKYVGP